MSRLIIIFLLLLVNKSFAQTPSSRDNIDFGLWTSASFRYQSTKKLRLSLNQQFRLENNWHSFDRLIIEPEAQYKINKKWKMNLGIRYVGQNDNSGKVQGYENHFRVHADLIHGFKKWGMNFENRIRYQNKNEIGIQKIDGDYPAQAYRWRTSIHYNFKSWKLDPIVSAEFFVNRQIGSLNGFKAWTGFTKHRYMIKTNHKLDENQKLQYFFMIEKETKIWKPQIDRILGVKYIRTINKKNT